MRSTRLSEVQRAPTPRKLRRDVVQPKTLVWRRRHAQGVESLRFRPRTQQGVSDTGTGPGDVHVPRTARTRPGGRRLDYARGGSREKRGTGTVVGPHSLPLQNGRTTHTEQERPTFLQRDYYLPHLGEKHK